MVDNPKEIGADRIVNTLAAHTLFGGPAIVVDFGTSTNLDVVSPKGEFLGEHLPLESKFRLTRLLPALPNCVKLN